MTIELGSEVKDTVTGFGGVAMSRIIYLNGCIRYEVQPVGVDKDGDMKKSHFVDEQQLEVIETKPVAEKKPVGGPRTAPPRMHTP